MMSLADLPLVNACLNGLSAILLSFGLYFILHKNMAAHRRCMLSAFASSILFLICYLTYHGLLRHGPTKFVDPAWFRPIYLGILLTHTVLAVVVVPLAIITLSRALKQRFKQHRLIARWTWPIWMYVSVTGVLIYVLLYQVFPQR